MKQKHNKLLNKLLTVLQLFVRLRDTDEYGRWFCISCGKKIHYKNANGGHYVPRSVRSYCIDLDNIHIQCPDDNKTMSLWSLESKQVKEKYRENLIKKIWLQKVLEMDDIQNQKKICHIPSYLIEELLDQYSPLVKKLVKSKQEHFIS